MLIDTIREDMRQAMKAGDAVRLRTLRLAVSACTNALVEMKRKPTDSLEDDAVVRVLQRLVKQRVEAAAQYRSAGSQERAEAEEAERAVLEGYLPEMLGEDGIRAVVVRLLETAGRERGPLMKAVMGELRGKADGSAVAAIVDEELGR